MHPRQLNMYRAWQSGAASATRLTSRPTLRPIFRRHRIRNVNRQQGARTYFRTQQSLSIQAAPLKHMARVDAVCRQPPSPLSPHWKCSSFLAGTHIINVPSFSMDKFLFQGRWPSPDAYEEIRREYEFGVGTIAGVASKLKVHRRMVREAIGSALPKPRKKTERPRWKLKTAVDFVDAVLEADRKAPRKQRHTAKRIYDRLVAEQRFAGSEPFLFRLGDRIDDIGTRLR